MGSLGGGRVPVSVNTDDTNFNTVEKTGGESTHKLVVSEMPKHKHTFTGTAGTTGTQSANHTHSGTSGYVSSDHTHRFDHAHGHSIGVTAVGNHAHGMGSIERYAMVGLNIVSNNARDLVGLMGTDYEMNTAGGDYFHGAGGEVLYMPVGTHWAGAMGESGSHAHGISGGISGTGAVSTAGISANHNHGITTGNNSANHTHSITGSGSLSETGSDSTHNNIQPYITVYMFKRTA